MSTKAKKSSNPLVSEVNRNFLIRYKFQDESKTFLISAGQYPKIVGDETAKEHFMRALRSGLDKTTIRVRNHLKIDFVGR